MHARGASQTHVTPAAAPGVPGMANAAVDPGGRISSRLSGSLPGKLSWRGRGAMPETRAPVQTGATDRQRIPRKARTDTALAAPAPTGGAPAVHRNSGRRTAAAEGMASAVASAAPQGVPPAVAMPAQDHR